MDGSHRVESEYADYMHTAEKVLYEFDYYGIIGYINLPFARYLILITKIEEAVSHGIKVYKVLETKEFLIRRDYAVSLDEEEYEVLTIKSVKEELNNTHFSLEYNLTKALQNQPLDLKVHYSTQRLANPLEISDINTRYCWNYKMLEPLWEKRFFQFIIPSIKGNVLSTMNQVPYRPSLNLILISRISNMMAGTGYWTRGCNDKGDVAVEVETECILFIRDYQLSFRMIRGSIPLEWNQREISLRRPAISYDSSRSLEDFIGTRLHFERLVAEYGPNSSIMDILGDRSVDRLGLSQKYKQAVESHSDLQLTYYLVDYKSWQTFEQKISNDFDCELRDQHYCCRSARGIQKQQEGVFRVNSLECIDETSIAQYLLFEKKINQILNEFEIPKLDAKDLFIFRQMWLKMSDSVAHYYLGTSFKHRFRIQKTISNYVLSNYVNLYIDLSRYYLSRFQGYRKQDRLHLVHGVYPDKPDIVPVLVQLRKQIEFVEYSHSYYLSFILLLKRYMAPPDIKTLFQFICAMIWTVVYIFLIVVLGIDSKILFKRPKLYIDKTSLPILDGPLPPEERGLLFHLDNFHTEFTNSAKLRYQKRVSVVEPLVKTETE